MSCWKTAFAVAFTFYFAQTVVSAEQPGTTKIKIEETEKFGAYLTDADGQALYLFTADKQGEGGTKAESNCYDACAKAWPPLLTKEKPSASSKRVQESLLGTIKRKDGATQVTYNGWPLYYFVKDKGKGEATGQDVHSFGGEWYLLQPQGTRVAK